MKKYLLIISILLTLFIISCSSNKFPEKFTYSPSAPTAGDQIEIRYKSDNEKINNSEKITMLVYTFGKELTNTEKVELKKIEDGWEGKVIPGKEAKGLLIKFESDNGNDNNNELGFVIKLFDKNGKIVPGANAGLATVYLRYAGTLDLLAAKDSATKYFELEFAKNPNLKRNYLLEYINSFPRSKRTRVAQEEINALEKEQNFSQKDLETLTTGFKINREFKKSEKYYKILKNKYPLSRLVTAKYYTRFRNMITIERMMEVFGEFNKINPENDLNNYMVSSIISKYASEKDYKNIGNMFVKQRKYITSNVYNSIAWKMFEKKTDLEQAAKYCVEGIKLARAEYESPSKEKPVYMADDEWKNSKKYSLAMILDTYGSIQNELGQKDNALVSFEEAVQLTDQKESSINENYTSLLFELGKNEEAKDLIEKLVSKGKASEKMKSILNQIFVKNGGDDKKFEEYIGTFEGKAKEKLIEKLKEEMKNEVAPDFELTDMDGKSVKLEDYKGKTLVLDFWATWCGPCLQSFPVMKKVVEKYADDSNVKFLFVNTWERVDDKRKNAEEFLFRSKYPFHVLLDDKNEVVEKYKVQGIPTKFIIDGNGKIRFQSVGYSGVESEVLEELDQMIAMVK